MSDLRRIPRPPSTHHRCPGACARFVPNHHFACDECWQRLPRAIRRSMVRRTRREQTGRLREQVESAARQWFLDNPPPVPFPAPEGA